MIETRAKTHTRRKVHPSALPPKTEGLDALDRERAASLADEGGSTAARVEREEGRERANGERANREDEPLSKRRWIFAPFLLALSALAAPTFAQTHFTPSAGLAFVSRGLLGFSVDFGYVKNLFGDSAPGGRNNLTTLMYWRSKGVGEGRSVRN